MVLSALRGYYHVGKTIRGFYLISFLSWQRASVSRHSQILPLNKRNCQILYYRNGSLHRKCVSFRYTYQFYCLRLCLVELWKTYRPFRVSYYFINEKKYLIHSTSRRPSCSRLLPWWLIGTAANDIQFHNTLLAYEMRKGK